MYIKASDVVNLLNQCSGICLDDNEWEYIYLATRICTLFGIPTPREWETILQQEGIDGTA